jgi:hypothetical protein
MVVVIACSGPKIGSNLINQNKQKIKFVSAPNQCINYRSVEDILFFHPDDLIENNKSGRDLILEMQNDNSYLTKAYELYKERLDIKDEIYVNLYNKFKSNLYIISAGWGIIRADFKLPNYDITFKTGVSPCNYRSFQVLFNDFNHLKNIPVDEIIVFIGSPDYINFFYSMTKDIPNKKVIFWKKAETPTKFKNICNDKNFYFKYYETKKRTGWYYELARKLINGNFNLSLNEKYKV